MESDVYRLFSIYIESEELPDDFDPAKCTIEQAEEFGELIRESIDVIHLLDELVVRLNAENLTDHNWFFVFCNEDLITF